MAVSTLLLLALLSGTWNQGRLRPPPDLPCSRDQLTAYTGKPAGYQRTANSLRLTIETDENTKEPLRLNLREGEKWETFFLWVGQPFQPQNWAHLERSPGKLKPRIRLTAWVCSGGVRPILDWQAPPE